VVYCVSVDRMIQYRSTWTTCAAVRFRITALSGVTVWTASNYDICHVTVLGRLITRRCGSYTNLAFHPSRVSKWGPPLAGKAKILCTTTVIENLADRRDWQSRKLFKQIKNRSGHCLHHLLPAKRDETVTSRLWRSVKLPQLYARANRFKNSFICFGLSNYQ